ncbi:YTH-domain-containing protein [Hypoxylon sp. FL0543]|nr:YTH-domain-containing protein [Hypoxylon sp. FL0543]
MVSPVGPDKSRSGDRGRPGKVGAAAESMLSPDLQDWLQMTDWHNVDYREKKLAQFRRPDIEEDQKGSVKLRSGTVKNNPDESQSTKTLSPEEIQTRPSRIAAVLSDNHISSYVPRGRSVSPTRIPSGDHARRRSRDYSRDYMPYSRRDFEQLRTPDESPPMARRPRLERPDYDDRPNRERVDDVRDLDREFMNLRAPKPLTLGERGKVRFFVMRSYSWDHVYQSMEDGLWATQREQADILSDAYSTGVTIVLFFAVNKSHGYQGYAIMKSPPSKEVRRPKWWRSVRWPISEPFEVEWMNTMHVNAIHVSNIYNRYNLNLPVTRARNCQEFNDSAGRQMVSVLESRAVENYKRAKRTGYVI